MPWEGAPETFKADFDSVDQAVRLANLPSGLSRRALTGLVNNSGITFNKPVSLTVKPEQFDRVYHVNIRAQFFLDTARREGHAHPRGGAICNITSIHGLSGAPEHSVYAGTKGAIIALHTVVAVELAHKGSA